MRIISKDELIATMAYHCVGRYSSSTQANSSLSDGSVIWPILTVGHLLANIVESKI